MGRMTKAERRVADFLTRNNIKWEFERPVSLFDNGERQRTFYPDFYLTEIGLYVEVCGQPRTDEYSRRDGIYKKNKTPIIYVHTYKDVEKWQYFLKRSIIEFVEKKQKTWTELNLLKQKEQYIEEKNGAKVKESIDEKWKEVVAEMSKTDTIKSKQFENDNNKIRRKPSNDKTNYSTKPIYSIKKDEPFEEDSVTAEKSSCSNGFNQERYENKVPKNKIMIWANVWVIVTLFSIINFRFNYSNFLLGLVPLIIYMILTVIIILTVFVPYYDEKKMRTLEEDS